MPDEQETPTSAMDESETEPAPTPDPEGLSDAGKRAIESERKARRDAERRLKELEPLAAKAREQEEASKSEIDKMREALDAERSARTKAESQLMRHEVAATKQVPPNLVRFLNGASREELEEAADVLLSEVNTRPQLRDRPRERLTNGQPSATDEDLSPSELAARILD